MIIRFLIVTLVLIAAPFTAANAQQCGNQPVDDVRVFKSEAEGHCGDSIYDRQFEYREKRLELRRVIEERREDYIQPALRAERRYKRKLAALNTRRSDANDITSK